MQGLELPSLAKPYRYCRQGNLSKNTPAEQEKKKFTTIFEAGYHFGSNEESNINLSHHKSTGY